ncbi:unnamed protein product [Prunus armeniaca]
MTKIPAGAGPHWVPDLNNGRFRGQMGIGTGIPKLEKSSMGMGRGWYWRFGLGMGDSPPTATTTGIPQNLLNGDEFEDGARMESRDIDGIVIFGAYPTHCHP